MSKQVQDIIVTLGQLLQEHQKLVAQVENHQQAMRTLDLDRMDATARAQDVIRIRIASIDTRRRLQMLQIAKLNPQANSRTGELTISQLAELHPAQSEQLLAVRDELRAVGQATRDRAHVASRVAGALLGHLNVAVRAIAGAVEQAGVYTKQGVPRVSSRIGAMEAVG